MSRDKVIPRGTLLWSNFTFLWTGVVQLLISYELDETGFGKRSENNLLAAAVPLGSVLCTIFIKGNLDTIQQYGFKVLLKSFWHFALLDMLGAVCTQVSVALIGSGIFIVIYSVIVVYIAILNKYYLGYDVSRLRWIALILITFCVALSALGQLGDDEEGKGNRTTTGIAFAIGATCSYGTMYSLLSAEFMRDPNSTLVSSKIDKKPVLSQTCMLLVVSLMESVVCLVYLALVALPNWRNFVTEPMKAVEDTLGETKASPLYSIGLFLIILIVDGLHQIGFYYVVSFGKVAAVSSGINKALQATAVFVFSHFIFCSHDKAQCMNPVKVIGTIGVCLGVFVYALDKRIENWFTTQFNSRKLQIIPQDEKQSVVELVQEEATVKNEELPTITAFPKHSIVAEVYPVIARMRQSIDCDMDQSIPVVEMSTLAPLNSAMYLEDETKALIS